MGVRREFCLPHIVRTALQLQLVLQFPASHGCFVLRDATGSVAPAARRDFAFSKWLRKGRIVMLLLPIQAKPGLHGACCLP